MVHGGDAQAVQLNRQLAEILRLKVTCQLTQPRASYSQHRARDAPALNYSLFASAVPLRASRAREFPLSNSYLGRLRDISPNSPPVFRHALC